MSTLSWIVAVALLVAFVVIMGVISDRQDQKEKADWQIFVDTNDCTIVEFKDAVTSSLSGPAIGMDGKMTFVTQTAKTPAQECWLCQNGKRYWKRAGLAIDRRQVPNK